jgi:2-polyprenyl-6-methoxyphenol hydroxylase-like FAD-dependent oxidoreductase
VFERSTGALAGRGAGIMTHPELRAALSDLGIATGAGFGVAIGARVTLGPDDAVLGRLAFPQIATSWAHVHGALTAALPPDALHRGADLVDVERKAAAVTAIFADGRREVGDILIGADGVRSTVRRRIMPEVDLEYAGYVGWRGLAQEADLSAEANFVADFAFCLPPGEQMLGYLVPGVGHTLAPGARAYNFVWYRPADAEHTLPRLLTDAHGTRHALAVPPNAIAPAVLAELRADAGLLLAPWFQRVVAATPRPFLQPIYDLAVPRMADGRIALLGDAAFTVRPHVGGGVAKAADDAAALAAALQNAGSDPAVALIAFSDARSVVGHKMIAQARRLGSYLKSTYASDLERREAQAFAAPEAVMYQTAQLDFLRTPT